MKRLAITFCLLSAVCFFSCRYFDNDNINIGYTETGHYYTMKAHFGRNKTRGVEEYMNSKIGTASNMSFVNTRIDGQLALDDHTTFYIKKYPGFLEIKLDKNQNSYEGYQEVKAMCEGIKEQLAK